MLGLTFLSFLSSIGPEQLPFQQNISDVKHLLHKWNEIIVRLLL